MPKLKLTKQEFDPDELDVEYDSSTIVRYTGEVPPTGTMLYARVTKAWWTYAKDQTPMIKTLAVAEQNEGKLEQYDGLPIWDNMVFKPSAAFKYIPFLDAMGLTVQDVFGKTYVAADDDNQGAPIEKIATWEPDSDEALCRVIISRERYNDEWTAHANPFLSFEDAEEEAEEDEDEDGEEEAEEDEEEGPDEDEEEDDEEDDEEDEPEPPTRGRRTAAASAPAKPATRSRGAARAASTAPAKPAAKPGRAKPAPPAAAPSRGRKAPVAAKAAAPASGRRTRRSAAAQDDPPF